MRTTSSKVCFCSPTQLSSSLDHKRMISELHLPCMFLVEISCVSIMLMLLGVPTSESMKPRPCFPPLLHRLCSLCHLLPCFNFNYIFILPCFAPPITHILPSLH